MTVLAERSSSASPAQSRFAAPLRQSYELSLLGIVLLVILVMALSTGGAFTSSSNLRTFFVDVAIAAAPAVGMTLVILTGGIDVSIGSLLGLVAAVMGIGFEHGLPMVVVLPLAVAVGGLGGLLNALIIVKARVPPIITTLGTLSIMRAAVFTLLGGNWISSIPPSLTQITVLDGISAVPASFLVVLTMLLAAAHLARTRHLGRVIYAVGNNEEAALLAGLPVRRAKMVAYVSLGLLTGLSAILLLGQSPLVQSDTGVGFELSVIAAVVVGGTSILGGKGSILGSLLGVVLVELVDDAVILYHIQSFWQGVVLGTIILIAVTFGIRRDGSRKAF